ncbi:SprT family zinc-dependent metalloprotease [Kerstersia gyiorum]|uniref:M48 family metallopeptidase n=1 Tax=Kerstersia gyiorum TaxID=206506 RepID=UPI000A021BF9
MPRSSPLQGDLFAPTQSIPTHGASPAAPVVPAGQQALPPAATGGFLQQQPGRLVMDRPAQLPPGAQWRETLSGMQRLGYTLMRSRRRTIGFLISDDGLRVTAPAWASQAQIDDAVRQKTRWIVTKLEAWQNRRTQLSMAHTRWQHGGEFPFLGVGIRLALGAAPSVGAQGQQSYQGDPCCPEAGDILHLSLPMDAESSRIREITEAWLQRQAALQFQQRLQHMATQHGLTVRSLRLSAARTRWGSCTSDGRIMLNWRLIHFSPAIIDYVIAHELAHLREMNHGPDFWNEVGRIIPDYEQARAALRSHHPGDIPVL